MKKPKFLIQTINSEGMKEEPSIYEVHELLEEKVENWSMSRRGFITGTSVLLGAGILQSKLLYGDSSENILAHLGSVNSVNFSPDGKLLASGSSDGTVKIWEMPSGRLLNVLSYHYETISSVNFSPDGEIIASGNQPAITGVLSGKLIKKLNNIYPSYSVNFSPDGKLLALGTTEKDITIWEMPSGRLLTKLSGHTDGVTSVNFSSDGRFLASGSWDKNIIIWEIPSGRAIKKLSGHNHGVSSVNFSPDGKILASGSSYDSIILWQMPSGKLLTRLSVSYKGTYSVNFSPDGKFLAAGKSNGVVELWGIPSGKLLKEFCCHRELVNSVSFSPEGKFLASGSRDKTIKIWDLQDKKLFISLFDKSALDTGKKVITYTGETAGGQTIIYTIPYGSAIPVGAVCTCNSVQGSHVCSCVGHSGTSSGGGGGSYQICTCIPVK